MQDSGKVIDTEEIFLKFDDKSLRSPVSSYMVLSFKEKNFESNL